jgi:hypothetical protein
MVNPKQYLTDIMQISSEITMGTEEQFQCAEKGTYRGLFENKHGKSFQIVYMR